jgi:hypothetical protein
MKFRLLSVTSVFLLGLGPTMLWGAPCTSSDPTSTVCTLHVDNIRPTQFSVGSVAVTCKAQSLSERSSKNLKKYLKKKKRQIPAVVGPDGAFYMTDHHHLSTALYRAYSSRWGNKSKILHVKVLDNFSTRDEEVTWGEFWEAMQQANRSYNYDNKGIPDMNFALLPVDVSGLLNDPYRTLSRWVRESCGYVKEGKEQCDGIRTDHPHKAPFFMEFYWGDFFRQQLPLKTAALEVCKSIPYSETCLDDEVAQLKGIYEQAMQLAASEDAKKYFEDKDLSAWDYGFNPSGEHLQLSWGGYQDACEEPVPQ